MTTGPTQEELGRRFAALHEEGCFLIPNPWDGGSARVLESLGFEALATTSSAFAFTLGRADGAVTLDELAEHVTVLAGASDLPISVDLENGYGATPEHAARAIEVAAAVGAVGGSIEDWDAEAGIYEVGAAAERIAAAAEAARGAAVRVHADGAGREPDPRQPRSRRHDRAAAGLRGGRGRRPLRARAGERGGDRCRGRGGRAAGQRAGAAAAERGGDRRGRGAADQRRRLARLGGGRGDGRGGDADARGRRPLRPARRRPGGGVARR